jgi:hypothetical protein
MTVKDPEQDSGKEATDQMRVKYGYYIILAGFLLVGLVFVAAVAKWNTAGDVTAVVGSVTSLIGTVVGAFLGVQVGSQGKEKAEDARKAAENKALRFAAALPPGTAERIMKAFPED